MALKGFMELLRLDSIAKSRTSNHQQTEEPDWKGVAFEVGGENFVAPIGEITEVRQIPATFTKVPLTKSWLTGVANIRGELVPLTDLAKYLNLNSHTAQLSNRKLLVIKRDESAFGLVVDNVMSIKNFSKDDYVAKSLPKDSPALPYNHGQFVQEGEVWPVFMPSLLTQDPRFIDASI